MTDLRYDLTRSDSYQGKGESKLIWLQSDCCRMLGVHTLLSAEGGKGHKTSRTNLWWVELFHSLAEGGMRDKSLTTEMCGELMLNPFENLLLQLFSSSGKGRRLEENRFNSVRLVLNCEYKGWVQSLWLP